MKTNSSFNLKKEAKRQIATIVDKHERGEYKRLCIEAQLNYDQAKRTPLKIKDKE
jgi:hypothetical protein